MSFSPSLASDDVNTPSCGDNIPPAVDQVSNLEEAASVPAQLPFSSSLMANRPNTPEKCAICLNFPEDRSFTDSCFHEFCFVCLLEWSKVKAECPLCKLKFKNIIHNIRSADDYDKYAIPTETESFGIDNAGYRFRFPTTMTVERVELLRLIRQLHLQMQEMERNNQIIQRDRQTYVRQLARIRRLRHLFERSAERRERLTATSDFRRVVYERRLRSIPPAPGERSRQCSPEFYRRHLACMNRLLPWLVRELNVLMSGQSGRVDFLLNLIRSLLTRFSIDSPEIRRFMSPYIGEYTEAFLHEFHSFARSPYDMEEYDRRVQYESWHDARARLRRPGEAPPEIIIGSSPSPERDHADDVITLRSRDDSSFRNPSPPPAYSLSSRRANQDVHRLSILDRVQTMIENNLIRLDANRRITRLARTAMTSRAMARNRLLNTTVELFSSSSSDDDDSPRLDPNARTPPYLLPRKRPRLTVAASGTRRRAMAAATSATSAASYNGVPATLRDAASGHTSRVGANLLPFSPAPVIDNTANGESATSVNSLSSTHGELDNSYLGISSPEISTRSGTPRQSSDTSPDSSPSIVPGSWLWRRSASRTRRSPSYSASSDRSPGPSISYMRLGRAYPCSTRHSPNGSDRGPKAERDRSQISRSPSAIDTSDVQVIAELKPKRLRTPEVVVVDDDEDIAERKHTVEADDDRPTTSGVSTSRARQRSESTDRKRSDRRKHKKHRHHHHKHSHKKKKSKKEKKSSRHRHEDRATSETSEERDDSSGMGCSGLY